MVCSASTFARSTGALRPLAPAPLGALRCATRSSVEPVPELPLLNGRVQPASSMQIMAAAVNVSLSRITTPHLDSTKSLQRCPLQSRQDTRSDTGHPDT